MYNFTAEEWAQMDFEDMPEELVPDILFYEVIRFEDGKLPLVVGCGDTCDAAHEVMERVKAETEAGEGVTYGVHPHYDYSSAPRCA